LPAVGQTAELFGKVLIMRLVWVVVVIHDRHRRTPNGFQWRQKRENSLS
jgi:hypothetical protein